MPDRTAVAVAAACATGLVAVVLTLGATTPPRPTPIGTDRLGPDSGEPIDEYLARAHTSLTDEANTEEPRWALLSLDHELTATAVRHLLGDDVRLSELWFRVPIERVQTPIVAIPVGGAESVERAPGYAAARLSGGAGGHDRAARVAAASAARLGSGCACVIAATLHAPPAALADVATRPGVRAVEALPPDAVFGRFAVTPLRPDQTVAATPGPDDGSVPDP